MFQGAPTVVVPPFNLKNPETCADVVVLLAPVVASKIETLVEHVAIAAGVNTGVLLTLAKAKVNQVPLVLSRRLSSSKSSSMKHGKGVGVGTGAPAVQAEVPPHLMLG